MAKDLEFDSERYEKRQSIKRWAIPAAALLAVVAVAVAVALILRASRGKAFAGGEDTPYPYRWTENKNGSVSLEIDRSSSPGSVWTAPEETPGVAVEASQGGEKTVFALTPREEGRSVLTFTLRDEAGDRLSEVYAIADAAYEGETLALHLGSVSEKQLTGTIRGGEDTPFPYSVRADLTGDLLITVTPALPPEEDGARDAIATIPEDETAEGIEASGAPASDWRCESGDETVAAVLGVIGAGEEITAYLRPGTAAGSARVRLYDDYTGASLTLELASDGNGTLQVLSHQMLVNGE